MPGTSDSHDTILPTTTTDPHSSLVEFAFAGPSSPQRTLSTTGSSAFQLQEGNYIRLPHFSIRGTMKRLELVLLVPGEHEHDIWEVREIKGLGFHHLKELEVVIKYDDHIDAGAETVKHVEERLDEWVDSEMVKMSAGGQRGLAGKLTVMYEKCMERKFGECSKYFTHDRARRRQRQY
ncbi:hypothetical protein LTR74_000813 [Friedmanniomyces endolithicus]|nr:hypothetical protein LTR74_000813 [Friedmanniomyces endolithicus]